MPGPPDWSEVIPRLLSGERAAVLRLARLVTGCLQRLRAYDFEDEWDDLRQEVMAAVLANLRAGRLRDPEAFVGYVGVVTRNKFMDRLKQRLRQGPREPLAWEDVCEAEPGPEPASSPELAHDVRTALLALPEDERALVEGVHVEGLSYPEAAARAGLPLGTFKRKLRESLGRLRERLSEADPETPRRETQGS